MSNLSAFQLFPPHIVEAIVGHVFGCSRLRYGGLYPNSNESKVLQMPLLWVCYNFRAVVYERFCKAYELDLRDGDASSKIVAKYSWPSCLQSLDYPTHRLAKELHLHLDLWSVFLGKTTLRLLSTPFDGCAFSAVRKLS
ncbi:hypothetical protein IWW38_003048, partial [Coemansia aciculifera]